MSEGKRLGRLAAASVHLRDRERQVQDWRARVELLSRSDADLVAGERALLSEMQRCLGAAFDALRDLAQSDRDDLLDVLDAQIQHDVWDTAAELEPELRQMHEQQLELLQSVEAQVKVWGNELDQLTTVVDRARLEGAPMASLEQRLLAVRSQLASLRSALAEQRHAGLKAQRDGVSDAIGELKSSVDGARDRVERIKALSRQVDLLIMKTELDATRDEYTYHVLLRSVDPEVVRGLNIIQQRVGVGRQDRDEDLLDRIDKLTRGINIRVRRDWLAAAKAAPAPAVDGDVYTDLSQTVYDVGQFLRDLVLPVPMHGLLRAQPWSLSITTNELDVPWELLCMGTKEQPAQLGEEFLCLARAVSRMPLGEVFPDAVPRRRDNARRRMLLIHSDPDGNLPAAGLEADAVQARLADRLDIVRLNPDEATNTNLNRCLGETPAFDFIHFAGHAWFDADRPAESGLRLKDSLLKVNKIRRLSQGGSLVFLNACQSGAAGGAAAPPAVPYLLARPEPVVGLASAFIYSGALGCVGSLWPVYDDAAAMLAVSFYGHLLDGNPTGESLRRARVDVRQAYPEGTAWAGYVLYGDPTIRLSDW